MSPAQEAAGCRGLVSQRYRRRRELRAGNMVLRVACSLVYFSKDGGLVPGQGQDVSHPVAPALIRLTSCDTAAASCPSCASASRCSAVDMPPGARSRRARCEGNTVVLPSVFRKVCATSSSVMAVGRLCQRSFQLLFCENREARS